MADKASDWSISQLYEKSWEVVKKHKVLWIFGAAASGIGLSSGNLRFDSSDIENIQEIFGPKNNSALESTQVLGTATPGLFDTLTQQIFSSIPPYIYAILGLELVCLFALVITFGLITQAWLQGALIQGANSALGNQPVTIRESSEKAFKSIKSLMWLQVIPPLVLILPILILATVLGVGLVLVPEVAIKILLGILLVASIGVLVYVAIYLALSQIWASRKVILEGEKGKQSLVSGYKISKKKGGSMMLLGLVNTILSAILIGLPTLVLVGMIFAVIFGGKDNPSLKIGLIATGTVFGIAYVLGLSLLGGILNAFKATVWTLAYKNIRGKYD